MRRNRVARHLVLFAFITSATAQSFHELFERASSCPDPAFNQCNGTGLPSNFCCPATTTCVPLAGNTTLLCCPSGNCDQIKPLSCDITEQNITLHPDNSLKTTALSSSLPTCGTLCCPFGYSCTSDTLCLKNADQSVVPSASVSASSGSPSATNPSTSSSTAKPTTTPSFSPLNGNATLIQACNKFPVEAVLVGFFPGLVLGILLSIASICIFGAQRRRTSRRRSGSSFGNISEPQPSEHIRTDFLRKPPQTPSSTAGSTPARQGTVHRVRSMFRKSQFNTGNAMQQSPRPPMPLVINKNQPTQHPVTPPLQRERSYEDVNIFADRDTASSLRENQRQNGLRPPIADLRASHQTTMDDVMGLAGLPKGQPYIYKRNSPAFTPSPKTRPN